MEMETFTLVSFSEVKWRGEFTQASIREARGIRVYGDTVFTEIGGFENTSSTDP
jgi:hypothetical protein